MKHYLFLIFLFRASFSLGQEILWERKFGWQLDDQIFDGFALSTDYAIFVGTCFKYGTTVNGNIKNGLVAGKVNIETGDTLWFKPLGMYCERPKCVLGENGLFYIVVAESVTPYRLRMLISDTNGNVIFSRTLDSTGSIGTNPEKLIRTSDGQFLLTGSMRGLGPGISVDMFALKFDALGNVLWNNRYNSNPNCSGNHVEETPEGHYILSGNAGARIWRVEVDSAGNVVNDDFLYQTPTSVIFDQSAKVYAGPYEKNYLAGGIRSTPSRGYIGKHELQGNVKNWGGETIGGIGSSYLNNDGALLFEKGGADSSFYWKVSKDSAIVWKLRLDGRLGTIGAGINKLVYLPDSSAIGLGAVLYLTSQGLDFYFCRISNVGVPYDPQNPNTAMKSKTKGESLVPYPNPMASSLVFKGLKENGMLYLFNLKGQVVKQMEIKPYQRVYLSDLPRGMYPYRIQTVNHLYTGKLVKE